MTQVSLVFGQSRYQNVLKALSLIEGDVKEKVATSIKILIKPNFVHDEIQLAATHVEAVKAVLDFLKPLTSRKITIAEASYRDTNRAFENFGYFALQENYNIEFCDLNQDKTLKIEGFNISKTILDSDFLISVTPPKTHDAVIITASLKNLIVGSIIVKGIFGRHGRGNLHEGGYRKINEKIARLAQHIRPHLAIVDAFEAMEGEGPSHGEPVKMNLALTGSNAIAVDSLAAFLMGFEASDIGYLFFANQMGLGEIDLSKIEILGEDPVKHRRQFRPHSNYQEEREWKRGK